MLFVTVGSQKFPFDRLMEAVDRFVESGGFSDKAFAQTGACVYVPKTFPSEPFLSRERFGEIMSQCNVVITHGGTGAIVGAVKRGKKVIAVPRLACFGEHVDDHQVEIVQQFSEMGLIEPCFDIEDLPEAYARALNRDYLSYKTNSDSFAADLSAYIDTCGRRL